MYMQLKQEVPTTDIAIQFLSTVASCDQMVTLRPLDDPSVEEVLCYTLQEEIRVTAKLGAYSGVCAYIGDLYQLY